MAIDKSSSIYSKIQSAYRAKFLKLQKQLEKEFSKIAKEFDGKIQWLVFKYANRDGVLDKQFATEINREIDAIVYWFTKTNAEWIDKNLIQSAKLAVDAQDTAARMYIKAAIEEYKGVKRELLTKAATDPAAPFLLRVQYGDGLPAYIRNYVWQRRWADGYRLSDRIWTQDKIMRQNLHSMIEQCINQGLSAVEFSRAVEQYLLKPGPAWTTKIKPSVTGRGSIKYNALRLARTETNNAYRTAHTLGAKNSAIVKGIKWNLSRSHPKYDICDEWATQDLYGLGPGVYPPDKLPPGHPNCLCYLTDVLLRGEELIKALEEKYQTKLPRTEPETPREQTTEPEVEIDRENAGTEYLGAIKNMRRLGGGASETFVGELDGKQYVFKADEPVEALDMITSNAEGEILASKIFNEVGLSAPKTKYGIFEVNGERKRFMAFEYVEGEKFTVDEFLNMFDYDDVNLEQFRKMQVVDVLIGNGDRHNKNFFLRRDGSVIPIDHNLAFVTDKVINPEESWQKCFLKGFDYKGDHQTPEHIFLRNTIAIRLYNDEELKGYFFAIKQAQMQLSDDKIKSLVKSLALDDPERESELIDILIWRRNNLNKLINSIGKP